MPAELGPWLDALRLTRSGWAAPAAALWSLASGFALLDRALADPRGEILPHEVAARREPVQGSLRQLDGLWPWAMALMEAEGPATPARLRLARRLVDLSVEGLMGIKSILDAVPNHAIGEVDQAWRLMLAAGEGGLSQWESIACNQEHIMAMAEAAALDSSARQMRDYAALAEAECAWRLKKR